MRTIATPPVENGRLLIAIMATLVAGAAYAKDTDPEGASTKKAIAAAAASLPAPHFRELPDSERPVSKGFAHRKWFDTEFGWIICAEEAEAKGLAEDVRAAAATFQRYFGAVPGRGAVVTVGATNSVPFSELEKAGAEWVMPWLDPQALRDELKKQGLGQAREQLVKLGLTGDVLDKALADVMRQLEVAVQQGKRPLRHELGHIWLIRTFWGAKALHALPADAIKGEHYGGPAHDWLDETAAVLMENDELTADRRREFAAAFKANPRRIRSLSAFFTMQHPGTKKAASKPKPGEAPSPEGDVKINVGINAVATEADKAAAVAYADFYSECRGFSDFLFQQTKDERIFQQLAAAEARDGEITAWLASEGPKHGLAATVEELNKQFRSWAAEGGK